ncbi:hypothetical protein BRADI_5g00990v3 [Brachypodium distachyon]|uniref:DUF6598 domain-containing protein n=1 Tax=Brachypodium distachyon TaxID=15368 RepID=A0A0Q3KNK5_BRADI|nr:hypothetical protein BRADI_5g00990v3 [Brachypodium distachyon]
MPALAFSHQEEEQEDLHDAPLDHGDGTIPNFPAFYYTKIVLAGGACALVLCLLIFFLLASSVLRFVQSVGSMEPEKRARLMRSSLGVPPKPWPIDYLLPESSRDRRHVGDLYWHEYYQMNKLSEDNPLTINSASDYLQLLSPKRGMSMQFDCLIEVDIKIKALSGDTDDKTLIDGCVDLVEGRATFDMFIRSTIEGENGAVVFYLIILRDSVEATIEMNFLEVPGDGFDIKMCGYTASWKNLYPFIDEQCDCDSSVASVGKFPRYFVAAVEMDDTLFIDFMDGNMPISFKAAIHGSEEKEYCFCNGAVVSVKVSWSAARY